MTVELSAAVMTHPTRLAGAETVASGYGSDCRIVLDPDPAGPPATLRTAAAAWATADPAGSHHLVLQDDVELTPDFAQHVRHAIAQHPDAGLAFFCEWGARTADALRIAALAGLGWAACADRYLPTQAVALPTRHAAGFARHAAALPPDTPDDNALMAYLRAHDVPALVKVINLVEHLDHPSAIGNQSMGRRRAACYLPNPPREANPAGVLPTPRLVPHLAWEDATPVYWTTQHDVTTTWTHQPLRPLLARHGLTGDIRADILKAANTHLPAALHGEDRRPGLAALADTACALGLASLRWTNTLTDHGELRLHWDADLLDHHTAALERFAVAAARSAAQIATAGTIRAIDCW
jgi:hypothetical protein